MQLHAVIFDLDGVLVDTARAHADSWRELAATMGIRLSDAEVERMRGMPRTAGLTRVIERVGFVGEARRAELLELKGRFFRRRLRELGASIVVPTAALLLSELRARGLLLGIASASSHAGLMLCQAALSSLVDEISDADFQGPPKPLPDQLLELAARLGVSPPECLVVEDSIPGLDAARAAGMRRVGVGPATCGLANLDGHFDSLKDVSALQLLACDIAKPQHRCSDLSRSTFTGTVRDFVRGDVEAALEAIRSVDPSSVATVRRDMEQALDGGGTAAYRLFIAEDRGTVVGLIGSHRDPDPDACGVMWLVWLFNHQAIAGCGDGRSLVEHAISDARQRGARKLYLDLDDLEQRRAAYEMYLSLGFKVEGRLRHYFADRRDRWLLGLELAPERS